MPWLCFKSKNGFTKHWSVYNCTSYVKSRAISEKIRSPYSVHDYYYNALEAAFVSPSPYFCSKCIRLLPCSPVWFKTTTQSLNTSLMWFKLPSHPSSQFSFSFAYQINFPFKSSQLAIIYCHHIQLSTFQYSSELLNSLCKSSHSSSICFSASSAFRIRRASFPLLSQSYLSSVYFPKNCKSKTFAVLLKTKGIRNETWYQAWKSMDGFGTLILMHGLFLLMQAFSNDNGWRKESSFFPAQQAWTIIVPPFSSSDSSLLNVAKPQPKIIDSSPDPQNDKCKSTSAAVASVAWVMQKSWPHQKKKQRCHSLPP